jgi:hypothetical protein
MKPRVVTLSALALAACTIPTRPHARADAHAHSRTAAGAARAAGCYQLTVGAWSEARQPNSIPAARRPPEHFALDTARLAGPIPDRCAVRPAALGPRAPKVAAWAAVGADSAMVLWSDGFGGVELRVQVRGDSLAGIARTFHDGHSTGEPPDPTAPVTARRVPCPPELRVPAG